MIEYAILGIVLYALWRLRGLMFWRSTLDALPGPERDSWISGNLKQAFSHRSWNFQRDNVQKYGRVFRLHGLLGREAVFVSDPHALYQIVVKEQDVFPETREFISTNSVCFGAGLLATEGPKHRKQRKMLNPVFSTAHMREMTSVMYPIAYKLRDAVAHFVNAGEEEIDIMYWLSRVALELIGQAGFGYSFDNLKPTIDSHDPYTQAVKQFTANNSSLFLFRPLLPALDRFFPRWLLGTMARATPHARLRKVIDIVEVMHNTSLRVYEEKKRALAAGDKAVTEQLGAGKDIMSILMQTNSKAATEDKLSEDELLGQMNTLIFAGSDTTSSALSKTLHVLACHPDAQTRLRNEIQEAHELHGELDYDTLMTLPYLDAVCREVLRCYPPVPDLPRDTAQDVVLTMKTPVKATDGATDIRELVLKKGTLLMIGIEAFNRDKALWGPDADQWKPERWLDSLPKAVMDEQSPGIFSHMMTFFGGSRACIGFKFSQLEMKVVLSLLVDAFEFRPGHEEIEWLKTGISIPIVKGQKDLKARLPMKISLAKRSS